MKPTETKSKIYLAIAGAIVAIWAGFLLFGIGVLIYSAHTENIEKPAVASYRSEGVGLKFSYPLSYNLTTRYDSFNGTEIHVLTLIHASSTAPDMSEGPTAISVIAIPVSENTNLEEWVRNASISNFNLSPDKKFSQTKVDGEEALAYAHSGLYESDAVALKHNGKIFIFAASWIATGDVIRSDFKNILSSVNFIE